MTMKDMGQHNFNMGVEYIETFYDDADAEDITNAVKALTEVFRYSNALGEKDGAIFAGKAIELAYAALLYPYCNDDGLDLPDLINELETELKYWK